MTSADIISRFITTNLHIRPLPFMPELRHYMAHSGSGLMRLANDDPDAPPPYWAYVWAGGAVLCRHISTRPEVVRGRRVLDFGAGGGIIGIAAALAGASHVIAADLDPNARAAVSVNAALNDVAVEIETRDLTRCDLPDVDVVLAGDVFYDREVADRSIEYLDRCLDAGLEILIGDPGRACLPLDRLLGVAEYDVPDFGDGNSFPGRPATVFRLLARPL